MSKASNDIYSVGMYVQKAYINLHWAQSSHLDSRSSDAYIESVLGRLRGHSPIGKTLVEIAEASKRCFFQQEMLSSNPARESKIKTTTQER